MSWNESGGNNKPRNPWDRKPETGPPDLDEIVRNLQRRLGGLFGRKGPRPVGGGGDGGGGGLPNFSFGLIGGAIVALWLATGFYQVGAAEQAIVTRFGKFDTVVGPGLRWHLPWPFEARTVVNTQEFLSFTDRTRMLTQDEALVDIDIAVQYRRADPVKFLFNVVDPQKTLGEVSESAIREIVGQSRLDFVLEQGRQEIAVRTRDLIQRTLAGYNTGLEVIAVNLQGVNVPEQVAPAQKDAIRAREDKDRLRVEAETYSNDIIPRARGTAQRSVLDAEAYKTRVVADAEGESQRFAALSAEYSRAPNVVRQRLYYETMENVLGNTTKVIVDGQGNGNMLYLPLDKLMERRAGGAQGAPAIPEITVTPNSGGQGPINDGRDRSRGTR
ncbi:MAG: FtsH protease activity modulator HflK [Pseudomonadota bacterium]